MTTSAGNGSTRSGVSAEALIAAMKAHRVGGTYWGARPALPEPGYVVVKIRDPNARRDAVASLGPGPRVFHWPPGDIDPWHVLAGAAEAILDADDEVALLARIAGTRVRCLGIGRFAGISDDSVLEAAVRAHLIDSVTYVDPFTGEPIDALEAVGLCGFWRRLIDSNRSLAAAFGFAAWKRRTVRALLWGGAQADLFRRSLTSLSDGAEVAVWRTRVGAQLLRRLEDAGALLVEVEDGFIRSAGLGAECVPPLSIVVDRLGAYFDPSRPSDLERIIEAGDFPAALLERARSLRRLIVESRISKYETGGSAAPLASDGRRQILVPGQVEDDRAVVLGGQGLSSNLQLLKRVRAISPGARIIYKPHPDVEAGHRQGGIGDALCLTVADEVVRNQPISGLIDSVDEVHVNTSLAGFEALLRGKPVTTHGVPFYAGWGLTRDLGIVPPRRTARRSLDELVAAAMLIYPRYLDPVTRLPCPPEVLLRRLTDQSARPRQGVLVTLRRMQGAVQRRARALGQRLVG
jgi:capsular polysaccharide export protein